MKKALLIFGFCLLIGFGFAQWSNNASNPTLIAGGPGGQVMPKVALGENGNTYISYFDAASGAYKVMLQLLDNSGVAVWPEPVEMGGSVSDTWLTDYDLTTDQEGNAIVCFQDIRSGANAIYIYKVSPSGEQLWGENGICLSLDSSAATPDYTPVLLNTQDNSTYVAWQHQGDLACITLQKLNPAGEIQWPIGVSVSATGATTCWPQLLESADNVILMKFYVDMGPFWNPNRMVRMARINPQGGLLWETGVSDATGIAAWTQIIGFAPDGSGGAVLSWHDDRDFDSMNQAWFARITADGGSTTPYNGAYVSSSTNYNQFYPRVICDFEAQEARIVFRITNSAQDQAGMIMQRMDYAGNRLMGDAGYIRYELSTTDPNPLFAWNYEGRFHYIYESTSMMNPMVQGLSADRNTDVGYYNSWLMNHIAISQTQKLHYDFAPHPGGWVICTWETGDGDVLGMRYWQNGNLGDCNGAPENVQAEFVPPNSIHVSWEHPQYSSPEYYTVQANDTMETLPPTQTEYTFNDLQPDTYQIIVRAIYEGGEFSPPHPTIIISVVSNSDHVAQAINLQLGPNPFSHSTQISWQNRKAGETTLTLYNLRGQKVHTEKLQSPAGTQAYTLQRNKLPAGIYFLNLHSAQGECRKKLVIMP
jgi:hypothetical protein